MSTSGGCGCDPGKVFEFADGSLSPEQEQVMREHLTYCPGCRELHQRELDLNAFLVSLDFSKVCSRSVYKSVAMALPTRAVGVRLLWGLLAFSLLVAALVSLELGGTEPVILAMNVLGAGWGLVVGSAEVVRTVLAAAGTAILLLLALGALVDVLIALAVVSLNRGRRAREV